MVSEHASPLAVLGGVDAGGQNVHVADLARARRGWAPMSSCTRAATTALPTCVSLAPGVASTTSTPAHRCPFPRTNSGPIWGSSPGRCAGGGPPTLPTPCTAHFWMSGSRRLDAARPLAIPVLQTFHALGAVKRRHRATPTPAPRNGWRSKRGWPSRSTASWRPRTTRRSSCSRSAPTATDHRRALRRGHGPVHTRRGRRVDRPVAPDRRRQPARGAQGHRQRDRGARRRARYGARDRRRPPGRRSRRRSGGAAPAPVGPRSWCADRIELRGASLASRFRPCSGPPMSSSAALVRAVRPRRPRSDGVWRAGGRTRSAGWRRASSMA